MIILIILLSIIGGISFYVCEKAFFNKEEIKKSSRTTRIIFRITFIISNLILSFVILQLILTITESDLLLWKFFLIVFSIFFYYHLPLYLIYNLFDHSNSKGLLQIAGVFFLHLILSNILYKFFKGSYEESIFEFNFYVNHLKILEYLAFIGDLFNGVSGAYNAVYNISHFFVYPLLKRKNLINNDNLGIKKKLEEINEKISLQQIKLNELNGNKGSDLESNNSTTISSSSLSESQRSIQNELEKLKGIQLSYEYQLGVGTRKEEKTKQEGIVVKVLNIIKVIQGFVFLLTAYLRCFTLDYTVFNDPVDIKQDSIIETLHKFSFIKFSKGFINFIEQTISLSLVFILFGFNWSVSRDRIMEIISYIFSYVKNKLTWFDVQLLIVCIMIFSYYLVCGLLVVNSMPNLVFKDKLHRYLFPGFDFESLHWYYDCPYVLAASFFIVKEIVQYSNIISMKP